MSRASKKERHRAKRAEKQRQHRKQKSISPIKRLADAAGEVEYWMSDDFEGFGQTQIFVYKRAAGLSGIACFLVDRGVVGLKDAWTRINIDHEEFEAMLKKCAEEDIAMRRTAVDEVRKWVAGGIRWAHENGMRLPNDWVKPAALIGGVGDWMSADVSQFVSEFAGHPDDLRQRLISEPFDSYIQRRDIDFDFSDAATYLDQKPGEYTNSDEFNEDDVDDDELEDVSNPSDEDLDAVMARFLPFATALAVKTQTWLATRNQAPASQLVPGWQSVLLAMSLSQAAAPDATEREKMQLALEMLEDLLRSADEDRRFEQEQAVHQALEHLISDSHVIDDVMDQFGSAVEPDRKTNP